MNVDIDMLHVVWFVSLAVAYWMLGRICALFQRLSDACDVMTSVYLSG